MTAASLNFFLTYISDHFAEEEQLMRQHGYGELERHQGRHQFLRNGVLGFQQRVEGGEAVDPLEFIHFLSDWVIDHILTEDRKYGRFFNQRGCY